MKIQKRSNEDTERRKGEERKKEERDVCSPPVAISLTLRVGFIGVFHVSSQPVSLN